MFSPPENSTPLVFSPPDRSSVQRSIATGRWLTRITVSGKRYHVGTFDSAEVAAIAHTTANNLVREVTASTVSGTLRGKKEKYAKQAAGAAVQALIDERVNCEWAFPRDSLQDTHCAYMRGDLTGQHVVHDLHVPLAAHASEDRCAVVAAAAHGLGLARSRGISYGSVPPNPVYQPAKVCTHPSPLHLQQDKIAMSCKIRHVPMQCVRFS